jgi:hypothetical protein
MLKAPMNPEYSRYYCYLAFLSLLDMAWLASCYPETPEHAAIMGGVLQSPSLTLKKTLVQSWCKENRKNKEYRNNRAKNLEKRGIYREDRTYRNNRGI